MISFHINRQTVLPMVLGIIFLTLLSGCTAPISSETSTSDVDLETLQELMAEPLNTPIEPTALALVNRDYALLQEAMSDPFTISYWDQAGLIESPEEAMSFLRTEYFDQADSIVIGTATDFTALLGFDIRAEVEDGEAFYLQWSGADLRSEGVALLERLPDGSIQWPYILIAENGFDFVPPLLPADTVSTDPEAASVGPYWETIQIESDPGRVDRTAELRSGLGVQQYVLYAQAGQALIVTASSQSTIPIDLGLMDPSGITTFAEDRSPDADDDSTTERSRYVSSSTLEQSGSYIVGLATLDGYSDVDYKVIIELYTPPDEDIPPVAEPSEEVSSDEVPDDEASTEEESDSDESGAEEADVEASDTDEVDTDENGADGESEAEDTSKRPL